MRAAWGAAVLAVGLAAGSGGDPTEPLEALRYNPRERTSAGLALLERREAAAAASRFDTALRLRPDDPLVRYNAGTADLIAGEERAAARLQAAAATAPPGLQPAVYYNLGNARLARGDAAGAVGAYKNCLRRAPNHAAAKHNLELAFRLADERRREPQSAGGARPGPEPREATPEPQAGGGDSQPEPGGHDAAAESNAGRQPAERPLPRFQDQPEMTAEEARAILEAVENLERAERRAQAERLAASRADAETDW